MNDIIRPLSIHEASFPVYGKLSPGAGNIVASLQLEGDVSADDCRQSLMFLMAKETSLRVTTSWLKKDDEQCVRAGYYFTEVKEPVIELSTSEVSSDMYTQAVEDQCTRLLNQPFQEGKLLWRSHLLSHTNQNRHTFFLCINHSVADGASVTKLLNDWLNQINCEHQDSIQSVSKQPLSEPLWSSMPNKIAGFFGAFRSLAMLPAFIKGQKIADQGLNFETGFNAPASEHRCVPTYRRLNDRHATGLLAFAKQQSKSVHGLISSGLIQPFLKLTSHAHSQAPFNTSFEFPFVTSVNMRDKVEGDNRVSDSNQLGCLSSGVVSMIKVNGHESKYDYDTYSKNPWLLGDQVSEGIVSAFSNNEHWKVLRFYQLVGLNGLKRMFLDASEKPLATPISFANLGVIQIGLDSGKKLRTSGFEVYAAFHASGAGVNVTANTLNGALTLCFTCPSPSMNRSDLEAYADNVVEQLELWADSVMGEEYDVDVIPLKA